MELRKVLFGYIRDYDGFHISESEADIVKEIFSLYISGVSLKNIADELTNRNIVYYQEKTEWNKSRIKRILENQHYCGDEDYPQIISSESFSKVQSIKAENCTYIKNDVLPEIDFLKSRVCCSQCGGRIIRKKQKNGNFRWLCENNCKIIRKNRDENLLLVFDDCISEVKNNPGLISTPEKDTVEGYTPSREVIRNEKEISRFLEQKSISFQNISKMILNGLTEKYACCSYEPDIQYTNKLCSLLSKYDEESPDVSILEMTIKKLMINKSGLITIVFRNNVEWHEKEENE